MLRRHTEKIAEQTTGKINEVDLTDCMCDWCGMAVRLSDAAGKFETFAERLNWCAMVKAGRDEIIAHFCSRRCRVDWNAAGERHRGVLAEPWQEG